MTPQPANLAASVHQRLLNYAKAQGVDFNLLLARFAIERFLCRLAASPFNERFVLKGAMLLQMQWNAFCRRIGQAPEDMSLAAAVELIAQFLQPVIDAARSASALPLVWSAGGPWTNT